MRNNTPTAARLLATDTRKNPIRHKMVRVDSSNIKKIGYRHQTRELFVDFHSGAHYRFRGVSQQTFDNLMQADSIGSYFAEHIRDEYKFSRRRAHD
jgi:KTSC domain